VNKLIKILLAIFLSPIGAFVQVGATKHFWINLILFLISFGVLGAIHALWLVLTDKKA